MKKSKLILLTVLIILVLYCGAIIFMTKPDTFAYASVFNTAGQRVVTSAPVKEAEPAVDTDALLAQMQSIAAKSADEAVAKAAEYTDAAVADAMGNIDIDAAVSAALDELKGVIVEKTIEQLGSGRSAFAQEIYDEYKDEIARLITDEINARFATYVAEAFAQQIAAAEKAPAAVSAETASAAASEESATQDYDEARSYLRDSEIQRVLNQLKDE